MEKMGRSIGTWILLLRKLVSKIRNMPESLETVLEGSAALYYKGLSSSVRQKLWLLEYQEVVCWQGLIELDRVGILIKRQTYFNQRRRMWGEITDFGIS